MHIRIGTVAAASLLFLAGAIGVLGAWSLGAAVVLLVATSVATAIAWEDHDAARRVDAAPDLEVVGSPVR